LIDESYNASPVAMKAALGVMAMANPGPGGRRIAVLGDMLELGAQAEAAHEALLQPICESRVDLVFACGPNMSRLFEKLPFEMRGIHAETSEKLAGIVADHVRRGDVVLVKGSLGSRMARVVDALAALDKSVAPAPTKCA
jgi:UDP-N-acetylmuramoyl-tripeptide--D-alanyl-D-alanine ligase